MPEMLTDAEALAELEQELERRRRSRQAFVALYWRAGIRLARLERARRCWWRRSRWIRTRLRIFMRYRHPGE